MSRLFLGALLAGFAAASLGDEYKYACQRQETGRTVMVDYLAPGERLPCRVRLDASAEGPGIAYLWYSEDEAGFCEEKATMLAEKFEQQGFACVFQSSGDAD